MWNIAHYPITVTHRVLHSYIIYGADILYIKDLCTYEGKNIRIHDNMIHFCGNVMRRDNDPYKIMQTRDAVELLMEHNDFSNELELITHLSDFIMNPLHDYYENSYKYLSSISIDYKKTSDYCNDIYSKLISENRVPSKWKNEMQMFQLISSIFPDARFQYYAKWIAPQNYDVYIPSQKIAFEYQGLQHYEPVKFFGGETAFERRKMLDKRKCEISFSNGIQLIYWNYDEPITKKKLLEKLERL